MWPRKPGALSRNWVAFSRLASDGFLMAFPMTFSKKGVPQNRSLKNRIPMILMILMSTFLQLTLFFLLTHGIPPKIDYIIIYIYNHHDKPSDFRVYPQVTAPASWRAAVLKPCFGCHGGWINGVGWHLEFWWYLERWNPAIFCRLAQVYIYSCFNWGSGVPGYQLGLWASLALSKVEIV